MSSTQVVFPPRKRKLLTPLYILTTIVALYVTACAALYSTEEAMLSGAASFLTRYCNLVTTDPVMALKREQYRARLQELTGHTVTVGCAPR